MASDSSFLRPNTTTQSEQFYDSLAPNAITVTSSAQEGLLLATSKRGEEGRRRPYLGRIDSSDPSKCFLRLFSCASSAPLLFQLLLPCHVPCRVAFYISCTSGVGGSRVVFVRIGASRPPPLTFSCGVGQPRFFILFFEIRFPPETSNTKGMASKTMTHVRSLCDQQPETIEHLVRSQAGLAGPYFDPSRSGLAQKSAWLRDH
jgi:hypothetical protein